MTLKIPDRIPLERTINDLQGHRNHPLVPPTKVTGLIVRCEQAVSLRLGELDGGHFRLLVGQLDGLPWILRPALGLVAHDPLTCHSISEGDLLQQFLGLSLAWWKTNPLDAEVIRRACARVSQRAQDAEEVVSRNAEQIIETLTEWDRWPWSPPPELDAPERWRMPEVAPLERSIEQLAGRGLEPMRPESPATARLRPALARPIGELTREQVRFLLEEHYGLPWLLPLALRWVEEDPLELTARHPGGILIALLDLRFAVVWRTNPDLIARLRAVLAGLEAAATDSDPLRSQGPLALLQRLEDRRLYPWSPSPLDRP